MGIADRHGLRALDTLHLSTVLQVAGASAPTDRVVLVSSDHELLAVAQAEGVVCLDPAAGDAIVQLAQLRG